MKVCGNEKCDVWGDSYIGNCWEGGRKENCSKWEPLITGQAHSSVSSSAGLSCELYAYCDDCKTTKLMIEDPPGESFDGKFIGGDISCECGKIVATLYRLAR